MTSCQNPAETSTVQLDGTDAPDKAKQHFVNAINVLYDTQRVDSSWVESIMHWIPKKPGLTSKQQADLNSNGRPIALQPITVKVAMGIWARRVELWSEHKSSSQKGWKMGCSTHNARAKDPS